MRLGAHESIAGGVYNAIYRGQQATCDTVQIFNKSNNQWKARPLADNEVEQYFDAITETGVDVACSHTSYLINIASPKRALQNKSYRALKEEMERCNLLKIPNLVMHPGSHVGSGEKKGMDRIARNINKLLDALSDNSVTLCLETTAGQGSNLGSTFEQLAYMIDRVEDQEHLGVCVDTCHIFAAGYPITDPADFKKTLKQFDEAIGLEKIKVFHVNDSKKPFASRRDRHEHLGAGEIGLEAFRNLVNDRRLKKIPMLLETPKGEDLKEDVENLERLRSLVKTRARKKAEK